MAMLAATAGCGKKGPPLAPFVRVPAVVTVVTGGIALDGTERRVEHVRGGNASEL